MGAARAVTGRVHPAETAGTFYIRGTVWHGSHFFSCGACGSAFTIAPAVCPQSFVGFWDAPFLFLVVSSATPRHVDMPHSPRRLHRWKFPGPSPRQRVSP